jgi:uncharacterized membrane protein YgcG
VSNLKNRFDLLGESIGRKVLPVVTAIITFIAGHTTDVLVFTGAITALGIAMGIASAVRAAGAAIVAFSGAEEGATLATIAWGTAMRLTIIGIIITALYLLVTHFKQVKAVALDAFHWMEHAASDVYTFFKSHWKELTLIIAAPLFPIIMLATHLKTVLDLAKKITSLPGKIAHGVGHFLGSLNPFHTGGLVRHMAGGGSIGGYGGGDSVPSMLEPGEFVLRKEAVSNIGVQNLNSINAGGTSMGGGGAGQVYVALPLKIQVGSRILAEQTAHFAAKKASLSGSYVSG